MGPKDNRDFLTPSMHSFSIDFLSFFAPDEKGAISKFDENDRSDLSFNLLFGELLYNTLIVLLISGLIKERL